MTALLVAGFFAALALLVFLLGYVLPRVVVRVLRWRDDREAQRQAAQPDPFPAVHMPADGDGPAIIPLSSRRGRQECRTAYQGKRL